MKYDVSFITKLSFSLAILFSTPLILREINSSFFFDYSMHSIIFLLASFLVIVTVLAYRKTKISRMLYSSFAFGILAIGQIVQLYILELDMFTDHFDNSLIMDVIVLAMISIFALSIFKR
jgi:hypothetical protein